MANFLTVNLTFSLVFVNLILKVRGYFEWKIVVDNNYYQPHYAGDWINGAFIDQVGNSNEASINMTNSSNGASINQEGDDNVAHQDLNSSQHKTTNRDRMGLDIDQVGNENNANQKTVASFGCYGIQGMVIKQEGNNNTANQLSVGGMQSTMEVIQVGNDNDDVVDVSATGKPSPLALPFVHKPVGEFTQYQNGRYSTASINVTGDNNHTAQYQEYTSWSVSGHNYAEIDIIGNENNAAQGQIGEFNKATITINGNLNVAAISQTGSGTAEWNGNVGSITQTGNNNVSSIVQNP